MRLGLTQRVVRETRHGESRDALAHDWGGFMHAALPECVWLPVPNLGAGAVRFLDSWGLDGLIFTGGDDPNDGARAQTESALLSTARQRGMPVFGVCRGMQQLQLHFGGDLTSCPVDEHVGRRHTVMFNSSASEFGVEAAAREVNSFHRWGIAPEQLAEQLCALALTRDGWVEAVSARSHRLAGVMWHPERECPIHHGDTTLIRRFFGLPDTNAARLGL